MEFVIVDPTKSVAVSEWVREEALARISAVEMVDLPLSELQQMIEDEFEEGGQQFFHSIIINGHYGEETTKRHGKRLRVLHIFTEAFPKDVVWVLLS